MTSTVKESLRPVMSTGSSINSVSSAESLASSPAASNVLGEAVTPFNSYPSAGIPSVSASPEMESVLVE